jgi:predicted phage terminase large subunit-like protein
MDSLLERIMPKPWAKTSVQDGLKLYSKTPVAGGWQAVKYKAHNGDFSNILWPTRWPKMKLMAERENYIAQGLPDAYSQEYLNLPIDETVAFFKRSDFLPITDELKEKHLNYYITIDLAIAEHERADYSVFLIAGMDEDRNIHVVDVIRDRLDGREIVDLILDLERSYRPEVIGIEEMQVSKAIGPFLREEMQRQGVFPNISKLKHGGKDKIARARSMQARVRAKTIYFNKEGDWYQTFEDECCRFPRDTHDDQVDAFAYLGLLLNSLVEAATLQEIEEEEYELELAQSESGDYGRNATTGY